MRVLQVSAAIAARYGGPSAAQLAYSAALASQGTSVITLTTSADGERDLPVTHGRPTSVDGQTVFYYRRSKQPGLRRFGVSWRHALAILRWTKRADVVYSHSLYLFHNLFVLLACRMYGKPYVVRPHGTLEPYHRDRGSAFKPLFDKIFGERYLSSAAKVHFVSESEAAAASDIVAPDRALVLGIPVAPPYSVRIRAFDEKATTVLFLGRVAKKKRLDLLLDAWQILVDSGHSTELVIAGPVDENCGDQLRRAQTMVGVRVLPPVDSTEKWDLLCAAGIFVLPSDNENYSVAVAEAMSAGLPCIVTRAVALEDAVRASGGEVVNTGSVSELADAIKHLLADADHRETIAAKARAVAEERFGLTPIGARLNGALVRIVAERT